LFLENNARLKMSLPDDECDYMSDEILNACTTDDIRPGLVHSRSKQREYEISKKKCLDSVENKKKNMSSKVLESERLKAGLEKPLGIDNKGYSMLQKMGFKPGNSLGGTSCGIVEPIAINIKSDRKGLGREQAIKEIALRKEEIRRKQLQGISVTSFRSELSRRYREREISTDLFKSEKACFKLDSDNGVEIPDELWFWPVTANGMEDEESAEGGNKDEDEVAPQFTSEEKLELLTLYLRKTYCYCIWCGVRFDDEKDLSSSCPGPTRDEH